MFDAQHFNNLADNPVNQDVIGTRLVYLTGLISAPCKACAEWHDEDRLTVFFRKYLI
jgi:hypothetical protein